MKLQTKAHIKSLKVPARKVRLLIDAVRGKNVDEAILFLKFSKKDAALPVRKLIESAIANAIHNFALKRENLVILRAFVDEAQTTYRWAPRAFGRAAPIRKRSSHVTVILEGEVDEKQKDKMEKEKKEQERVEQAVSQDEEAHDHEGHDHGRSGVDSKTDMKKRTVSNIKREKTRRKV